MKPPLRTVLRNFLNHFEDYEARKMLGDDQYEHEFQQLKKLTDKLKNDNDYSCWCALKDVNKPKNRYKDIVPYDKSRVILPKSDGVPGSDYINASHIKGASGAFAYIAAQGPLPNTVIDFWRMIWLCDVQVVVMACNETESGKNKCDKYWPSKGEIKNYDNITVELIDTAQVCSDFLIRTLLVKCDSEMRDVYQFHYTSWPDHGIPDTVQPILELVRLMRQCQATEIMPIVVHCSAGCGRTGTICAVDFVWACLRHGKLSEDFSLFQIALELRRQRIAMIQTKEQYILAHKVVATLFEQQLNVIDCHPYVNIDEDGEPLIWKELTKNKKSSLKDKSSSAEPASSIEKSKRKASSELNIDSQITTNGTLNEASDGNLPVNKTRQRNSLNDLLGARSQSKDNLQSNMSISDSLADCSRNSESSFSRNSYLSQQSTEDGIPFIDDDEVCVRPQCGRAYLNIPSCDSISKIVDRFDPFVDRVSYETDESSPEADIKGLHSKGLDFQKKINAGADNSNGKFQTQNIKCENSLNAKSNTAASSAPSNTKFTVDCSRSDIPTKRESYPSVAYKDSFHDCDSIDDKISIQSENIKGAKAVGRATVVRKPSISKLKALFEKSGISSCKQGEGGKRLLFRNNTHHVSRAGSAPPSLNCMDKNAANERESILMMVTRKFRSASVRTEREVSSKTCAKSQKKTPSTITNFKEGIATLSRTVSFNLNKKLRNNLPTSKVESSSTTSENSPECSNSGCNSNELQCNTSISSESQLSPPPTKSKSMWYDKSSLPRIVAIVKPTGKLANSSTDAPISPKKIEKTKIGPFPFTINKPPKLLPFLSNLSKTDARDSTMWYSETDNTYVKAIPTGSESTSMEIKPENVKNDYKNNSNKVFPLIQSFRPWKKVASKAPLNIPESPKSPIGLNFTPTFYSDIDKIDETVNVTADDVAPVCPVPEEIIPLSVSDDSREISSTADTSNSADQINNNTTDSSLVSCPSAAASNLVESDSKQTNKILEEVICKNTDKKDIPPAIPKKMHIGKNKTDLQIVLVDDGMNFGKTEPLEEKCSSPKPIMEKEKQPPRSPNDLYINVNETAKKNIEQIEKTIRNNPRSAIIDLTSRESYCMEEELANAVKQLANLKPNAKGNSKFPGYEVIWPDDKIPTNSQIKFLKENQSQCKTGICYSPPLRRSFKANINLAKSSSCSNIDWLEPSENLIISGFKEGTSPTKKLVKEAAVELNTLLDRLTTQTLSEANDLDSTRKPLNSTYVNSSSESVTKSSCVANEARKDNLMTHSVTLVSKSSASNSSPREEEIVFHFPPPPRNPPPKDDVASESFDIVVKDGSLIVSPNKTKSEIDANMNSSNSDSKGTQMYPQPAPRKSKIRKSASYTNLWAPQNKGYENVFLEKYQTLSRLQIGSSDQPNGEVMGKEINDFSLHSEKKTRKTLPDYVNVRELLNSNSSEGKSLKVKPVLSIKNDRILLSRELQHHNMKDKNDATNMSRSYPQSTSTGPSTLVLDAESDPFSTYGKIQKLSVKKQNFEYNKSAHQGNIPKLMDKEIKRNPISSRKTERAPLPPDVQLLSKTKDIPTKLKSDRLSSERLPSRKQEKAPLPPPLLQKSPSAASISKKSSTPYYANFARAQCIEETHALPAVRENITNIDNCMKISTKKEVEKKEQVSHVPSHCLSHSRSDASVFFALKERKTLSLSRDQKLSDTKVQITNKMLKRNKELASVSSSDSDSSYERIFFEKSSRTENITPLKQKSDEQTVSSEKSLQKELPIAPPRARRRNTTEIHYAKVKSKETTPLAHKIVQKDQFQQSARLSNNEESPPAIPVKTRDVFEVPEESQAKEASSFSNKSQETESSAFFKP